MTYSEVSDLDPRLVEVSFYDVRKDQSVLYLDNWYKALEDSHVNEGMVGFRAENEDFNEIVIQVAKNDMGYAPKLYVERTVSTADDDVETSNE